jgi:large subunit ribosomal protein L13
VGATAHRATQPARPADVESRWYVIDAEGQVLGRLATRVAMILRGKHRPDFTPHVDHGDGVIVVNAEKVRLTGRKLEQKTYHRHSGYVGSVKSTTAGEVLAGIHPERVIHGAVRGMLPKNSLGRKLLRKLKLYAGPDHPHAAQKPEEITLG